ncbi:MAG TPA: tripartite tricarboxylate transporter substrate binding protein [Casimicrobium huifangae]|uniref:tripartite tricarboxylate transporter substrate binding protein n=1 Tax=Casimicrobium huifangae TaxID=2591109 RepID=UPI001EE2E9B3|nr:tripartite tricarboxylate transporter substrate binding protein [Casimicrobium huifangae]HOB03438.1 tripartite tricarboxylate transporter substrate binding protein [Casimicrobium huifangae]HQA34907.1 tripartite tricarboxylate transporter substrate binding protein [Casimicrobium huifangae]HQD66708.1 tripartite tricarboxylate transporter substrate binding protein [Casimicrobium huifangae]
MVRISAASAKSARRFVHGLALIAATAVTAATAPVHAQSWPTKQPIKLVAVFPPGGSVDQVARILAQPLQAQLGQTVIVENKGGASGSIGAAFVAQAPADGYTCAVVFDSHAVNPALIPSLPFDTKKDLAAVSLIGTAAMTIATPATSEYKSFADVATALKAGKPVSYGTIGNGSLGHLAMTLLGKQNGLNWQHVPYKGGGPMMQDAVGGHVPLVIGSVFVVKPHIDSGRVRALAVTTAKRSPELPNVPALAEVGYGQFEAPAWWAVLAPAKTPPEIVARMNAEISKALQNPDTAKKLEAQGINLIGGAPETARVFIEKQIDIWGKVVKDYGIKAD